MRLVLFREFSLTIEYLSEIPRSEADPASRWLNAWPIMTQRGIRALGAKTVTSALLGTLRTDPRSRAEFFALAGGPS
jgi:GTP cyclohydrolase I